MKVNDVHVHRRLERENMQMLDDRNCISGISKARSQDASYRAQCPSYFTWLLLLAELFEMHKTREHCDVLYYTTFLHHSTKEVTRRRFSEPFITFYNISILKPNMGRDTLCPTWLQPCYRPRPEHCY